MNNTLQQKLISEIYLKCFKILELNSNEEEQIFKIVKELSTICTEVDFQYDILYQFYCINDILGFKESGFTKNTAKTVEIIKDLAQRFSDKFEEAKNLVGIRSNSVVINQEKTLTKINEQNKFNVFSDNSIFIIDGSNKQNNC